MMTGGFETWRLPRQPPDLFDDASSLLIRVLIIFFGSAVSRELTVFMLVPWVNIGSPNYYNQWLRSQNISAKNLDPF